MSTSSENLSAEIHAKITVPRCVIAGIGSQSGVSSIYLGILAALKHQKLSVSSVLVGSRLIEATRYRRISGRICPTIDLWMLTLEQNKEVLARSSIGADIVLVQGEYGLFDKYPKDTVCRMEAEFFGTLKAPVVLVVDVQNLQESVDSIIRGICSQAEQPEYANVKIVGVIANRIQNTEHGERVRNAITSLRNTFPNLQYLGGIPDLPEASLVTEENLSLLNRSTVKKLQTVVLENVNLELLKKIIENPEPILIRKSSMVSQSRICRIAVAEDSIFHITQQANLELLKMMGAELIAFSPLSDRRLPPRTHAVYLPNAYVADHLQELGMNFSMHQSLQEFVHSGGLLYAEGSSIAYCCQSAQLSIDKKYNLVGILPARATYLFDQAENEKQEFFITSQFQSSCTLHSIARSPLTRIDDSLRGSREYQWMIQLERPVSSAFEVLNRNAIQSEESILLPDGLLPLPNVILTSAVPHWGSCPEVARVFVERGLQAKQILSPAV
jgi:cobyrinic acid a,c-diamide synthase